MGNFKKLHPQYLHALPEWRRIRACMDGGEAVKAGGEAYLPRPDGMTEDKDYAAYRQRALFFGATSRTVNGLLGAMFRKDPTVVLPSQIQYLIDNADGAGTALNVFLRRAVKEVLSMGRLGLLTEISPDGQPYLAAYVAENVTNWREVDDATSPVDQVILREYYNKPAADGFGSEIKERYRVLSLVDGAYSQTVYADDNQAGTEEAPQVRGRPIEFIPFSFIGADGLSPSVSRSPVAELSAVNISHYQTQADLEHAAHWTGLPTLVVIGAQDTEGVLRVGSTSAVSLPAGAEMKFVEFSGAGLSVLEKRAEAKEGYMVLLGARLLEDQKKAAETAESKRLQYSGENSILAQIANLISDAVTKNLTYAYQISVNDFARIPEADELNVSINTDFFDAKMSGEEITALIALVQNGLLSRESAVWNLKEGEILPPGASVESEMDAIDAAPPTV